jgi:molecular chaperone GrpE
MRRLFDPWQSFASWPSVGEAGSRPMPRAPAAQPPAVRPERLPEPRSWPPRSASIPISTRRDAIGPDREPHEEAARIPPSLHHPPAPPTDDAVVLQSALEDLASAKRRVESGAESARDAARAEVVAGLFPVLDNLDRSIASATRTSDRALLDGVGVVRDEFERALTRCGLERIESVGRPFDPREHDALAVVEVTDPERDGTVFDEIERGYRMAGKVLRAPKVRVARFSPALD